MENPALFAANIPILMYHNVATVPKGGATSLYVTQRRFDKQMRYLFVRGYVCMSLAQALQSIRERSSQKIVALTFDDGYQDTLENALPILKRYGFTGSCFVLSKLLGKYNEWDRGTTVKSRLMSVTDLIEWQSAGMEVGVHGRTHRCLIKLDDVELRKEVHGAKNDLEDALGQELSIFAYPYGIYDKRCRDAVISAGYVAAVTASLRRANLSYDMFALPRLGLGGNSSLGLKLFVLKYIPFAILRRLFPVNEQLNNLGSSNNNY